MEKVNIEIGRVANSPNLQRLIAESKGAARASNKRRPNVTILLDDIIKWIKTKYEDKTTSEKLIQMASSCPQGSLNTFIKNIDQYLQIIQQSKEKKIKKIVKV